jgi:Uma2 family endonuclease
MSSTSQAVATLADLARVEGKAELIGGRIVHFMASGLTPSQVAFLIARMLYDHVAATGRGIAFADGIGFVVPTLQSGRQSFSPDASYYFGPYPSNKMKFIQGPPTFAVEVRSEGDYGDAAEEEMAAKRADYFEAGTLVVWDVDPIGRLIHKYARESPGPPTTFRAGEDADAEPALAGWRLGVDRVFA